MVPPIFPPAARDGGEHESLANPYNNASCESSFKTLKRVEIYATEYADIEDLREQSRSSSSNITTRSGCTRLSGTAHPMSSNNKPGARVKLQRWLLQCALSQKRRKKLLQGWQGRDSDAAPFPDPIPAGERTKCKLKASGVQRPMFQVGVHSQNS